MIRAAPPTPEAIESGRAFLRSATNPVWRYAFIEEHGLAAFEERNRQASHLARGKCFPLPIPASVMREVESELKGS